MEARSRQRERPDVSGPQLAQLIELLLGAATILAFLWVAIPDTRPWAVVGRCVGLPRKRKSV